ncbi:MAG: protein kinase [Nocardioides sp.]|nr:protein kinase [Nocardioides sp.]
MGEVFAGRYELLDPIASGGMGTVWCVLDQSDGDVKAAKILRQSDASSLLRFVREQSMRIDHLHVVTPQSWAGMDDRVLFTMPLMRGGSVSGLLKKYGALPLRWVGLLTDQTLQALEAVHAADIVHRDIKPANLLLEATGNGMPHLRLTDFGIAAPLDEPRMTRASMVIGSPGYMAPEQWQGADPDYRSDLYSVARVSLELLTGERPSSESSGVDLSALRNEDERFNGFLDLLEQACAEDPLQRQESATQMREQLAALDLVSVPVPPGEPIVIEDEFRHVAALANASPPAPDGAPTQGSYATQQTGGTDSGQQTRVPSSTSVLGAQPVGQPPTGSGTSPAPPSRAGSVALIGAGVLALVAAILLLVL